MIASKKVYVLNVKCTQIFKIVDFGALEERMAYIPTIGAWQNVHHVKYLGLRCCSAIDDFSAILK